MPARPPIATTSSPGKRANLDILPAQSIRQADNADVEPSNAPSSMSRLQSEGANGHKGGEPKVGITEPCEVLHSEGADTGILSLITEAGNNGSFRLSYSSMTCATCSCENVLQDG